MIVTTSSAQLNIAGAETAHKISAGGRADGASGASGASGGGVVLAPVRLSRVVGHEGFSVGRAYTVL